MPRMHFQRNPQRKGLYLPMGQVSQNPSLLFPLTKSTDPGLLEEQVRVELEKVGITKESDVQAVLDKAEEDYELRIKVKEAQREIRRLMKLRAEGAKLMSAGNKKWKEVYYPKK